MYVPLKRNTTAPLKALLNCQKDVKSWVAQNFLNKNKTEVVLFGPPNLHASIHLGPLEPYNTTSKKKTEERLSIMLSH